MGQSQLNKDGDNLDLEIVVKGIGLRSLHFGLWKEGQPVTVDEVAEAQKNFTVELVGMFPEGVEKVLDVGAGLGDNAIHMAGKGMKVTCVSPSQSQERYFEENILPDHENISFVRGRYEALEMDEKFDVVLMSESSNYFPMENGLDQTKRYLKDGGYLVMGALFRKDDREEFEEQHIYQEYLDRAKERGLTLVEDLDVTGQVVQTLELTHSHYRFIPPVTEVLIDFYRRSFGKKHWVLSRVAPIFFKKEIALAKKILLEDGPRRTDPKPFLEYTTYRFLAFEKNGLSARE